MRIVNDLVYRVRALMGRGRMERELDEEVGFHLEMQARQLVEQGWAPERCGCRGPSPFRPGAARDPARP